MCAAPLSPLAPGPRTGSGVGRAGRAGGLRGVATDPWALYVALWLLAALLAVFTIRRPISPHDEGLMLQAGARIAAGQWPYHDFWSNYPPGQATLLAALDELFGISMMWWRIVWVAVAATTSGVAFALLRRERVGLWLALLGWLGVAGAMAWPSTPEPNPSALLLAFAALLACGPSRGVAPGPGATPGRPLLAGALAGLCLFFRLEIGVAAVLGALVLAPPGARARTLGAALVVAVCALGPFFVAAPGAMVHDTLGFYAIAGDQRLGFPLAFHGPLKPDKLLEFYFPLLELVIAGIGALGLVAAAARGRVSRLSVALIPLAIVGVGYLLGRTDPFHELPLSATLAVALAAQAPGVSVPAWLRAGLVVGVVVIAIYGLDRRGGQLLHPPPAAAMPGPIADGVQTTPADARALRRLIAFVDSRVAPGAPILVAPPRFDVVRVGNPLLYLVLNRPNPTRYDVMQPGLVTTASVQREMIADLRRARPGVVVRWVAATARAPSGERPGSHLLDRWIAAHYRPARRYGDYRVLVARRRRPG